MRAVESDKKVLVSVSGRVSVRKGRQLIASRVARRACDTKLIGKSLVWISQILFVEDLKLKAWATRWNSMV